MASPQTIRRSLIVLLIVASVAIALVAVRPWQRTTTPPPAPVAGARPATAPLREVVTGGLRFSIDRLRGTTMDGVVTFAEGNSARLILARADDPTWETERTPEAAIATSPSLFAPDKLAASRRAVVTRADGIRYATIEERLRMPGLCDQWHISRYVYVGDHLIVIQGVVLGRGDIDADYRSLQLLTDSVRPAEPATVR